MLQACSDIDIFNIFMHTEEYKSINTRNEGNRDCSSEARL